MDKQEGKLKVYNAYGHHSNATGIGEVSILGKDLADAILYFETEVRERVRNGVSLRPGWGTEGWRSKVNLKPTIDKWQQVEEIIDNLLVEAQQSNKVRAKQACEDLNKFIGIENVTGLIINRLKAEADLLIKHKTAIEEPQASIYKEERLKLFQIDQDKELRLEKEREKAKAIRRFEICEKAALMRWHQRKGDKTIRKELMAEYKPHEIDQTLENKSLCNEMALDVALRDANRAKNYARNLSRANIDDDVILAKIQSRLAVNEETAQMIWAEISTLI